MDEKIERLFEKMLDPNESEAYAFAEKLGACADESSKPSLMELVRGDNWEHAYLAIKALSKSPWNDESLSVVFEAIFDRKNSSHQGAFVQLLEDFDLQDQFVNVFRVYLFGNFKASTLAKMYLDEVEFEISPRTIRKAEKHWNHYIHNPEDPESMHLKKSEAEAILKELKELFA